MEKINNKEHRVNFLKKIPLFHGVKPSSIQKIASEIQERKIHNRDTIYFAGEESESIYIVRYGEVAVRFAGNPEFYLGPGEVLAEVSVLTGTVHSGTAVASIDCLIYEFSGKSFLELAEKDKALAKNLINLLSGRFRENLNIKKSHRIPRRLIVHVKLDPIEDFAAQLNMITSSSDASIASKSVVLSSELFKDLSGEKMIVKLSDYRQNFPVIHISVDQISNLSHYENLIFQADYIIFYEKDLEKDWNNKINFLNHWKKKVRNYEGRVIRYIIDKKNSSSIYSSENEKIISNGEFLGRFLVSRTRGLTLGGGGARALAHVGLLKVLESQRIRFDYVSGASMGAVIGALYARGESASSIEMYIKKFFGGIDSPFDPRIPFVSFYAGKKMKKMLKEVFKDERIEDYPIPFVTSSVDLQTGEEFVFDKGPLWEALLCAMSLPAVFPPVFLGDHLLVDGGIINNVPDNLIRRKGADKILCVNVSPLKDKEVYQILEDPRSAGKSILRSLWEYIKFPPILRIMTRANTLEGREITKARVSSMDCFLNFHLEEFGLFDFQNYKEILEKGESEANIHMPEIVELFFPRST
jgi:NTE family protein